MWRCRLGVQLPWMVEVLNESWLDGDRSGRFNHTTSVEMSMTPPRRGRSNSQRPHRPDRKTLQMCSQVQRTLDLVLSGDMDDDRLRDLYVSQVVPAPDASCLLVSVTPHSFARDFQPALVMARLAESTGKMRSELARVINRRKTPELMFRVVMPEDATPPYISTDVGDVGEFDDEE